MLSVENRNTHFRTNRWQKPVLGIASFAAALGVATSSSTRAAVVSRNVGVTLSAANVDSYNLDVDQNGTTDFTFDAAYVPDPTLTVGFDQVAFPFASGNAAVIDRQTGDGFPAASVLVPGNSVSSASVFSGPNDMANLYSYDPFLSETGNFGGKTGFVGFRFDGTGGTHYGYVQVTVKNLSDPTAPFDLTLGTVVYDNVAGAAVTVTAVPEPTNMVLLIMAGTTLTTCTRRRSVGLA